MKDNLFMGIDVGTQSVRVGIVDRYGKIIAVGSRKYETIYPKPGWAEQKPVDWWRGICEATKECIQKLGKDLTKYIDGISFDATSSTVLMVDEKGMPMDNAIMWMDKRAIEEVEIIKSTNHPILRYVGGQDAVEWMVPKALWFKKNNSDLYKKAFKVIEATDWVAYKLTNKWTASLCNVTCKWNYVSVEGGWNYDFFKAIGIEDVLSKWPDIILPMGNLIGGLSKEASKDLGIRSGIPVAEGGIDAHVGLLGLNALEEGRLGAILGSSNVFFILKDNPKFSANFWGPYPDAIIKGKWLLEGGQVSSGSIINWLLENTYELIKDENYEIKKEKILKKIEDEINKINIGSDGLVTIDYWQGNRTPRRDPNAKGIIFGLTLAHSIYHLTRSIYEGISFGTKHIIDCFKEKDLTVDMIVAGGGGTKSQNWIQIMADVCGLPIYIPYYAEHCGLIGASICAATGAGIYNSLQEAAEKMVSIKQKVQPHENYYRLYERIFDKYLKLYEQTTELLI